MPDAAAVAALEQEKADVAAVQVFVKRRDPVDERRQCVPLVVDHRRFLHGRRFDRQCPRQRSVDRLSYAPSFACIDSHSALGPAKLEVAVE